MKMILRAFILSLLVTSLHADCGMKDARGIKFEIDNVVTLLRDIGDVAAGSTGLVVKTCVGFIGDTPINKQAITLWFDDNTVLTIDDEVDLQFVLNVQ